MPDESLKALFQPTQRRSLSRSVDLSVQESLAASPPLPGVRPPLSAPIPHRLIPDEKRFEGMAIGGAPAWAVRIKRIETLTDQLLTELDGDWRAVAQRHFGSPGGFAAAWRERLANVELGPINELIRRHNRYFPIEANLPMSPRTGEYVAWGGRDWRKATVEASDVLLLFPADLDAATMGSRHQPRAEDLHEAATNRNARHRSPDAL